MEEYEHLAMVDYYMGDMFITFIVSNEPNNEYVLLTNPSEWIKGNFYFDYEILNKGYSGWSDDRNISLNEKFDTVLLTTAYVEHEYSMDPINFLLEFYKNEDDIVSFEALTYDENNENHILLNYLPEYGYLGWRTLNDSYFVLHRDIPEGYRDYLYNVNDGIYVEEGSLAYTDEPYSGVALNRIPDDVTRIEKCGLYYALEVPTTCEYITPDCLSKCEYIFVRGDKVNENLASLLSGNNLNIQILCQDEYLDVYGMLMPSTPHNQQVEETL